MERAKELLHEHRIEKLLVVEPSRHDLCGLITIKDIEKSGRFPNASKDDLGRLLLRRRHRRGRGHGSRAPRRWWTPAWT